MFTYLPHDDILREQKYLSHLTIFIITILKGRHENQRKAVCSISHGVKITTTSH